MASQPSNAAVAAPAAQNAPTVVKIVIAGGFAVGKTTFIGSISDIDPLNTEAAMTEHSVGVDDAGYAKQVLRAAAVPVGVPLARLDTALWTFSALDFVPHVYAGSPHAARTLPVGGPCHRANRARRDGRFGRGDRRGQQRIRDDRGRKYCA